MKRVAVFLWIVYSYSWPLRGETELGSSSIPEIQKFKLWTGSHVITGRTQYVPDVLAVSMIGLTTLRCAKTNNGKRSNTVLCKTTSSIVDARNGFEIWKMDKKTRINPITDNIIEKSISTPCTIQPLITAMIATRTLSEKTMTLNSYSGLQANIETVQNIGQICDIAAEVGGEIGTMTKIAPKIRAAAAVIAGAGKTGSFICKLVEGQLQQDHNSRANNKMAKYKVSAWGGGYFRRVD